MIVFVTKQAKLKESSREAANRLLLGGDTVVKPPVQIIGFACFVGFVIMICAVF